MMKNSHENGHKLAYGINAEREGKQRQKKPQHVYPVKMKHKRLIFRCLLYLKGKLFYLRIMILIWQDNV